MSLPTYARFFKYSEDGEHSFELGRIFVNIGWWWDEEKIPFLIEKALKKKELIGDWDYVHVYGEEYTKQDLELIPIKCAVAKFVKYGYISGIPPKKRTSIQIPFIKKVSPELIARDIVDVQPMTAPVSEIFNIRREFKE